MHGRGVAWERECSHVGVCAYACESVHVCLTTYGVGLSTCVRTVMFVFVRGYA